MSEKIFRRICDGQGRQGDLELINDLADNIKGHTICFLGDSLAMPAQSFIKKFGEEIRARIVQ